LNLEEVQDLKNDIKLYLELEKTSNLEFWQAMMVVCESVLETLRDEKESSWKGSEGVHQSVKSDIHRILNGKSVEQLDLLRDTVTDKLDNGKAVDVEYWETLLKNLNVYKAKAKLRVIHGRTLEHRLEQMKERQRKAAGQAVEELVTTVQQHSAPPPPFEEREPIPDGNWSPRLLDEPPESPDTIILDPTEDWRAQLEKREEVKKSKFELLGLKQVAPKQLTEKIVDEDEAVSTPTPLFVRSQSTF